MKLTILLIFGMFSISACTNESDSLIKILDLSLTKRDSYIQEKEKRLAHLKNILKSTVNTEMQYKASKEIMEEYKVYACDSSLYYATKSLTLANKLDNKDYKFEIQLERALLLSYSELFNESFNILDSVSHEDLSDEFKAKYYQTYIYVYYNMIKDTKDPYFIAKYNKAVSTYIDQYLAIAPKDSAEYQAVASFKYYQSEEYGNTIKTLQNMLDKPDIKPYTRAIFLADLAEIYLITGEDNIAQAKKNYILASIEYNNLSIMVNPPLLYLAMILAKEGDIDRAYKYINIALDDSRKFSNKHRNSAIIKIYPVIQEAYTANKEQQKRKFHYYSIVLTIAFFILVGCLIHITWQVKLLKITKEQLREAIGNLKESNYIKEQYIGYYLNECSSYINKLDEYRKFVDRKLIASKVDDSIRSDLKLNGSTKEDLERLYQDFDHTFLSLYPNFIEEVNELLSPDGHYAIRIDKEDKFKLNPELRILGLLRLGVTENKQIASFLRYTVQTVYNYRSRAKARAIVEDSFENDIKRRIK